MYKVIFHVDEINKAALALNNIKNLITDLGNENLQVELLVNSEGVNMLLKAALDYNDKIQELHTRSVVFSACANSMKGLNISKEQLYDFAQVVPSGVGELVKKQADGFAYIKP